MFTRSAKAPKNAWCSAGAPLVLRWCLEQLVGKQRGVDPKFLARFARFPALGKHTKSYGTWDLHGIFMGFLWDFYGIFMGFPWDFYGIVIGFLWGLPSDKLRYLLNILNMAIEIMSFPMTNGDVPICFIVFLYVYLV